MAFSQFKASKCADLSDFELVPKILEIRGFTQIFAKIRIKSRKFRIFYGDFAWIKKSKTLNENVQTNKNVDAIKYSNPLHSVLALNQRKVCT